MRVCSPKVSVFYAARRALSIDANFKIFRTLRRSEKLKNLVFKATRNSTCLGRFAQTRVCSPKVSVFYAARRALSTDATFKIFRTLRRSETLRKLVFKATRNSNCLGRFAQTRVCSPKTNVFY